MLSGFVTWEMGRGQSGDRVAEGLSCSLAVMFCGLGGFSDFYKRRWLEAILSWQKPQEGCFGKPGEMAALISSPTPAPSDGGGGRRMHWY